MLDVHFLILTTTPHPPQHRAVGIVLVIPQVERRNLKESISSVGLLKQSATDWCFTYRHLFSHRSGGQSPRSKCPQGWVLLKAIRSESVPGLSPWIVDGCVLLLSSLGLPSVCFRTPVLLD